MTRIGWHGASLGWTVLLHTNIVVCMYILTHSTPAQLKNFLIQILAYYLILSRLIINLDGKQWSPVRGKNTKHKNISKP
jgi:hypothetical protein